MKTLLTSLATREQLLDVINDRLRKQNAAPLSLARFDFLTGTTKTDNIYRHYTIPKRRGGKREISAPRPMLKRVQRILLELLSESYTPREAVKGFVRGGSVCDNAAMHVGRKVILNMDLKDFFPSISHQAIVNALRSNLSLSPDVAFAIASLCTISSNRNRVLPQGAPTSPILSNLVCCDMDEKLSELAKQNGAIYTRYADDITFSAEENIFADGSELRGVIASVVESFGFIFNEKKSRITWKGRRMEVTGIVVEKRVNVPRSYVLELRQLIYMWDRYGLKSATIRYSRHHNFRRRARVDLKNVIQGKIAYLSQVRGATDDMVVKFKEQFECLSSGGHLPRKLTPKPTPKPNPDPTPQPTPTPDNGNCLSVGYEANIFDVCAKLNDAEYGCVSKVVEQGQYVSRGMVIDFYPWGASSAVRVNFYGTTIDSVRCFDVATQTAGESIEQCSITPRSAAKIYKPKPQPKPEPKPNEAEDDVKKAKKQRRNGCLIALIIVWNIFALLTWLL